MAEPLLAVAGVTKDYGTAIVTRALRGIDFSVEPGEFLALTGPSGSGKSTLLNLIGLLDRPTSGRIAIRGTDTGSLDADGLARFRGRTIGFVFQFHHLLPAFSATENVLMPAFADLGRITEPMRARAESLLRSVGLGDRLDRKPSELSGGQQQRVAIARALMMEPALLLADEPTGNLDQESGEQVFQLLRRLNAEEGVTCAIVTHDDRLAVRCDRNIHLVDGLVDRDQRTPQLA
ncbi:MAG: ABC transporter ATP-binding protein [Gemmatimonadales bacterium]|nr:ABC transporter ATP-binding protein [Gemmatimonadales bacterium]